MREARPPPVCQLAAAICRCISASVVFKEGHTVAIPVQERIVNFVRDGLLVFCLRLVETIHGRIQTHEVGVGGRAARV